MADTLLTAELDDTHLAPSFAELGVRPEIVRALAEIGIERTFAIQELTLPLALAGEDLIGQARTGMGKTFGFGVPLLHRIATGDSGTMTLDGTPRALIIVPTRELCMQVTADLENASKYLKDETGTKVRVHAIYGGRPYDTQIAALRSGVDVVVGTPGRLLDLAQQNHLILGKVQVLVLDEADEMLDLGFLPDIERILNMVPEQRQTMLFSATMPGPIITLARTFLSRPTHIRAEEHHESAVHDRIQQLIYRAHALDKSELVARILQAESRGATMIFARTKRTAQKVADDLAERGFAVGAVHGDLGQIAREKALKKFREGKIDVLVATDVAARGIDIDDVTHVINYQCPEDEKTYVHRIGRTGRAGKTGVAVTLVDWDELHRWASIDKALELGIPEPVETYSRSPHLYAELGIPEGITGVIRKRPAARDEDAVVVEREARAPRSRNRRRTRGGQAVEGEAAASTTTVTETVATEGDSTGDPEKSGRRRRRRRRGKGGNTPVEAAANTTEAEVENDGPATVSDESPAAENGNGSQENGNGSRRNRTRNRRGRGSAETTGSTEATEAVQAPQTIAPGQLFSHSESPVTSTAAPVEAVTAEPVAAEAAADATAPAAAEAAPRKRTRKATKAKAAATETAPAESAAAEGDSAEPVLKAPRKRAAKAATEEAAGTEAVAAEEAPKKTTRKRATKAASKVEATDGAAEVVVEAAEAPKAPARKRTRKAVATTDAADAVNGAADAEPAPKKRVRKATKATVGGKAAAAEEATAANGSGEAADAAPVKRTRRKKVEAAVIVADDAVAASA
ncbi:hypothetical protein JMUB6875_12980 [Nocardia sp. JMUB6875]